MHGCDGVVCSIPALFGQIEHQGGGALDFQFAVWIVVFHLAKVLPAAQQNKGGIASLPPTDVEVQRAHVHV